jgi:translation initiation factor 2 subunit 3
MSKDVQPEINIGMIGHVDHGKTTLTKALTGRWTDTHSEEIKRGITIRLGYADATFYKCPKCKGAEAYTNNETCPRCKAKASKLRTVSFVDAPGHESLMATMLSGAAIMDGALLMIAANEECPQPQTREHLMALEIIGVENVIIIQNKIDLISEEEALKNYNKIKEFIKGTKFEKSPIIPVSAHHNVNIDVVIETIEKHFKTPKRDAKKPPLMFIARSFDINSPGVAIDDIKGGILGGSLKQGILKEKDEIEIAPGRSFEEKNKVIWKSLITNVTGLMTGKTPVKEVVPGGSMAILTSLDPAIVKSDSFAGNVVGLKGKMPPVLHELKLDIHLLKRVIGSKAELDVESIKIHEPLMLNINSAATIGVVTEAKAKSIKCTLKLPICAEIGSRATISRRVENRFRLIGYGIIN